MKTLKLGLSIILVTIFAILMCSCTSSENGDSPIFASKTTLDAKDYITIDYGKYDGYSSPSIDVDYDALSNQIDIETFNNFVNTLSTDLQWEMKMYDSMADIFDIELKENYNYVSNGDKIIVKIAIESVLEEGGLTLDKICDGLKIKFKNTEIEYAVSGLKEPKNFIDIFEGIEQYIIYEGANGNGRIGYGQIDIPKDFSRQIGDIYLSKGSYRNSVKIIHNNTKIGEISYHIEGENLSGGDVIEITTSCPTGLFENLGYIVPATKKNTIVPDLGEYLTSEKQLTSEITAAIKDEIYSKRGINTIDKFYYTTYKPGIECKFNSTSFMVVIFYQGGWLFNGYCIDELNDIIIKPDGTITVESYKQGSQYEDTLAEAIDALAEDYYDFIELQ